TGRTPWRPADEGNWLCDWRRPPDPVSTGSRGRRRGEGARRLHCVDGSKDARDRDPCGEDVARSRLSRGIATGRAEIWKSVGPGGQDWITLRADSGRRRSRVGSVDSEDARRWNAGEIYGSGIVGVFEEGKGVVILSEAKDPKIA